MSLTQGEYESPIIFFWYKFGFENSVSKFVQDSFRDQLINQSVTCVNAYMTLREQESRIIFLLYKFGFENSVYVFGQDSFRDRLINQSVTQLSYNCTRLWESRNRALFSSGTNLGSKIQCTFFWGLINQSVTCVSVYTTLGEQESRIIFFWYKFGLENSVYILDKIHLINQSIRPVNISRETHYSICYICQRLNNIRRVGMTHYFLLVQIWARKFGVRFWTRFILLINV